MAYSYGNLHVFAAENDANIAGSYSSADDAYYADNVYVYVRAIAVGTCDLLDIQQYIIPDSSVRDDKIGRKGRK